MIDRRRRSGEGTVVALTCLGQPVGALGDTVEDAEASRSATTAAA